MLEFAEAVEELRGIKSGKIHARNADEFLDERMSYIN